MPLLRSRPCANIEVSAHEIVAALPRNDDGVTNDQCEGSQDNAREAAQARVSNHPFPNFDVAALRTQAVLEGFINVLRDAQSGKSLHAQASSEVSPALSDILCSIPTRHGPQSWRQKRCRSARIIVDQVNNKRWRRHRRMGCVKLDRGLIVDPLGWYWVPRLPALTTRRILVRPGRRRRRSNVQSTNRRRLR